MCHICLNIENTQFKYYNEGDLRVWWIPQLPMKPFYWKVESPMEAVKLLDILAMYDMFQFEHNIKPDFSNAGGLEVFEDGEWSDWYSEDGLDIDEWYEENKKED